MLPQSLPRTKSNTVLKKHKENIFVIIINLLMSRSLNITAGCPWGEKYLNILSNSVKQTWTLRFRKQTICKNLTVLKSYIVFSYHSLGNWKKNPPLLRQSRFSAGFSFTKSRSKDREFNASYSSIVRTVRGTSRLSYQKQFFLWLLVCQRPAQGKCFGSNFSTEYNIR